MQQMASEAQAAAADAPPWRRAAFVEAALRRAGDAGARVEAVEAEDATGLADHYASNILRLTVRLAGRSEPTMLLVKSLPDGDQWTNLVHEARLFDKEMIAFSRVLPRMEALLEEAAPGKFPPFAAKYYAHSGAPDPFLLLQDLKPQGFGSVDRRLGLDLAHSLLSVRALGRMHAVSAALWRREPALFDGLLSMFNDAGSELWAHYFDKTILTTSESIDAWKDFPGNFGRKVGKLRKNIFQKFQEATRVRPGKFNVLVHADYWVNNLMYRHENEQVQDIRMVDFQMVHVGNPAIDLLLFQLTTPSEEVFDKHWEYLMEEYHTSLTEVLQLLGEKGPSLQDIRDYMHEGRVYSFLATLVWLPATRLEEGKLDNEKTMQDDRKLYTSPSVRYWLEKLLPTFDERGMFDEVY